jgi:predicted DNA-binding transcriptional regulator YafY
MSRTERFYQIDQLLAIRKVMSRQDLLSALEVSWATLKRDLAYMRDRLNAPIEFDRDAGGYRFCAPSVGPKYELPGLWFNADETYALLTTHQLLCDLEPGLLAPHVAPLLSRLEAILGQEELNFSQIANRIRLGRIGKRRKNPAHFSVVSRALLERQQLQVRHYSREHDTHSDRTLSPQRMIFYRNNWYLEAWCHERKALRRFSVDALESVELLTAKAKDVSDKQLNVAFATAYGIYGGAGVKKAHLRFSVAATRWVADEEWHPDQVGSLDADGRYLLEVPFAEPTELLMDILRHGHHVEVLGPLELRRAVMDAIKQIQALYPGQQGAAGSDVGVATATGH